ncbi:MAG: hypothetical protein J6Q82_07960 [Clostridia bacterium]|nr:hypothetical protein [Clostridia bacterium]
MNGTMNQTMKGMVTPMMQSKVNTISTNAAACEAIEPALVAENCKASAFSLATFAGSVLLCLGIIAYALLTL